MNMNTIMKIVNKQRKERFEKSEQLSLGQLLNMLKQIPIKYENEDVYVCFDFGNFIPEELDSWRGSYNELAIRYKKGYNEMKLSNFIKMLENAIGTIFYGYKGGQYIMNEDTPLWVSNYGDGSHTAVVGIINKGFEIILETKYMEF